MSYNSNFFSSKRKWSLLKDELIGHYLPPYLEKIKRTNHEIIIVDCFAGKGVFDDGEKGSPIIIAEKVSASKAKNVTHLFLIESKYSSELLRNMERYSANCDVKIWSGFFQSYIKEIVRLGERKNVFLYIDPYGIKPLDYRFFIDFRNGKFNTLEELINFNTFGFLREGCRVLFNKINSCDDEELDNPYELEPTNSIENMDEIAGGDYWQKIVTRYAEHKIVMHEAEELFANYYSKKLGELSRYVINVPIKTKTNNVPKYRMYFMTSNIDGLFLMADEMNSAWGKIVEEEKNGQKDLFEEFSKVPVNKFSDLSITQNKSLNKQILGMLDMLPLNMKDMVATLIVKNGISYSLSEYRNAFRELEESRKILIKREIERTPTGRNSKSLAFERELLWVSKQQ